VVERVPSFEVVLGAAGVGGRALREILDRAAAVPFVSRPQAGTT
jgi:hypothetical protein